MTPLWTVLIPTLGQRRDLLARLLAGLMPQVDAADGAVRVVAAWDNGGPSPLDAIAAKRQRLVEATTTDYLSMVDDDDTVSDAYVPEVLKALESRPDQVGLWQMNYVDGIEHRPAELSLKYDGWFDGPTHYCRDITQANPMLTKIARTADFRERGGEPEDRAWAAQLRAGGLLRTEAMVDRVLHHHWWVPSQSTWITPGRITATDTFGWPWQRLAVDSPNFSWLEG